MYSRHHCFSQSRRNAIHRHKERWARKMHHNQVSVRICLYPPFFSSFLFSLKTEKWSAESLASCQIFFSVDMWIKLCITEQKSTVFRVLSGQFCSRAFKWYLATILTSSLWRKTPSGRFLVATFIFIGLPTDWYWVPPSHYGGQCRLVISTVFDVCNCKVSKS